MLRDQRTHLLDDIEFKVIYSGRRTLGISVLPDSSVIVRAPYLTSYKTISRIVKQKAKWIITHIDNHKKKEKSNFNGLYYNGEIHPLDLKQSTAHYINELIKPVREHFEKNKEAKKLKKQVESFKVTR